MIFLILNMSYLTNALSYYDNEDNIASSNLAIEENSVFYNNFMDEKMKISRELEQKILEFESKLNSHKNINFLFDIQNTVTNIMNKVFGSSNLINLLILKKNYFMENVKILSQDNNGFTFDVSNLDFNINNSQAPQEFLNYFNDYLLHNLINIFKYLYNYINTHVNFLSESNNALLIAKDLLNYNLYNSSYLVGLNTENNSYNYKSSPIYQDALNYFKKITLYSYIAPFSNDINKQIKFNSSYMDLDSNFVFNSLNKYIPGKITLFNDMTIDDFLKNFNDLNKVLYSEAIGLNFQGIYLKDNIIYSKKEDNNHILFLYLNNHLYFLIFINNKICNLFNITQQNMYFFGSNNVNNFLMEKIETFSSDFYYPSLIIINKILNKICTISNEKYLIKNAILESGYSYDTQITELPNLNKLINFYTSLSNIYRKGQLVLTSSTNILQTIANELIQNYIFNTQFNGININYEINNNKIKLNYYYNNSLWQYELNLNSSFNYNPNTLIMNFKIYINNIINENLDINMNENLTLSYV
jgi:hypothetical protein